MLRVFLWILSFSIIALIATELVLRYKYGFLSTPLYVSDADYEYIYAPDQDVWRFGNHIKTNEYSLRSEKISPTDTTVILLCGDSVVLGGSLTDNDSLASTILEKRLSKELGRRVRVLNIAAGSWGPDNVAAYLKKHGLFHADLLCLVASSHDYHDHMDFQDVVGNDINYPDQQYDFALEELWDRYIYPRYVKDLIQSTPAETPIEGAPTQSAAGPSTIQKPGTGLNPGFAQLKQIALAANIPFFILLHPEISEVEYGHYDDEGEAILQYAKADSVRLIRELDMGIKPGYFRENDVVHYNDEGQRFLADQLYPVFLEYLKTSN
ncbi:hypothetical protein [Persicitalea jodogahamensis]|uniref:SGNH hydrolase-type esterase domain-containing protein n=1 Tax=Persicitalea jodogahamensis TaxID=402147 RepID=A0A8J3G9J7_9BACT|nr:hypothetical protein [Persicitalea jodogahamensis]GHB75763.1 hypothetical protein GCM10007390_31990 [Persicitalea jodogahamensis]